MADPWAEFEDAPQQVSAKDDPWAEFADAEDPVADQRSGATLGISKVIGEFPTDFGISAARGLAQTASLPTRAAQWYHSDNKGQPGMAGLGYEVANRFGQTFDELDSQLKNQNSPRYKEQTNLSRHPIIDTDQAGNWTGLNMPNASQVADVLASSMGPGAFIGKTGGLAAEGLGALATRFMPSLARTSKPIGYGLANAGYNAPLAYSQTYQEAYQYFLNQGDSPEVADQKARGAGKTAAGLTATISGPTGMLSGLAARNTGRLLPDFARGTAIEALGEMPEEALQQAAQDKAIGRPVDWTNAAQAGLLAAPGAVQGGMFSMMEPITPRVTQARQQALGSLAELQGDSESAEFDAPQGWTPDQGLAAVGAPAQPAPPAPPPSLPPMTPYRPTAAPLASSNYTQSAPTVKSDPWAEFADAPVDPQTRMAELDREYHTAAPERKQQIIPEMNALSDQVIEQIKAAGPRPVVARTRMDTALAGATSPSSPLNSLPEPTEAQKHAGNYKKPVVNVQGLNIAIETPEGATRKGTDKDGKPWEVTLEHPYGYIKKSKAADGEQVDAYIGPNPQSQKVWVVDQVHADTQKYDEAKGLVGFDSQEQALEAYRKGFSDGKGDQRIGAVTEMTIPEFKQWVKKGNTTKPLGTLPKAARKKGTPTQSLLDFVAQRGGIEDVGGDLKAMNAERWHRGKVGRKKLLRESTAKQRDIMGTQENPYHPDDVARAAWEAGYFPEFQERPTPNDLYDAIGQELAGKPRYKTDDMQERMEKTPVRDKAAEQDRMERHYLAMADEYDIPTEGRDLDDIIYDVTEREAIMAEVDGAEEKAAEARADMLARMEEILPELYAEIEDAGLITPEEVISRNDTGTETPAGPATPRDDREVRQAAKEGQSGAEESEPVRQDAARDNPDADEVSQTQDEEDGQKVIPGAERISDKEMAQRQTEKPLRASKPQAEPDEGLFDTESRKQTELFEGGKNAKAKDTQGADSARMGTETDPRYSRSGYESGSPAIPESSGNTNLGGAYYGTSKISREENVGGKDGQQNKEANGRTGSATPTSKGPMARFQRIEDGSVPATGIFAPEDGSSTGGIRVYRDRDTVLEAKKSGQLNPPADRIGRCYELAGDAATEKNGDFLLGVVLDPKGRKIWHSVAEFTEGGQTFIYDPVMNAAFGKEAWNTISPGWIEVHRMSPKQVDKWGAKYRQYPNPQGMYLPTASKVTEDNIPTATDFTQDEDPYYQRNRREEDATKENTIPLGNGLRARLNKPFTEKQTEAALKIQDLILQMAPKAKVRWANQLYGENTDGTLSPTNGAYLSKIIHMAMDATNQIGTARHEVIHALRQMGFINEQEWQTISALAKKEDWIKKHRIREIYAKDKATLNNPEALLEEAIAEHFATWRTNRKLFTSLPDAVRKFFHRMDLLLRRVRTAARQLFGAKFDANDIFTQIERGEIGKRTPTGEISRPVSFQSPLILKPFYSALQKGVGESKQPKATPDQWKGILRNLPGVKAEELEWSAVNEWLDSQTGPVTKQALQDYLQAEGSVDIQEVVKKDPSIEQSMEDDFMGRGPRVGSTKFSQYQLPGGENYRELLLTLPQSDGLSYQERKELESLKKEGKPYELSPEKMKRYNELSGKNLSEDKRPSTFRSSHYDEPNILAHIRFNERTDAEGNRVLFIEEVQSDWHQAGRKKGYKSDALTKDWTASYTPGRDGGEYGHSTYGTWDIYDENNNLLRTINDQTARTREQAIRYVAETSEISKVPDAPFKKTWHELALKRMLRYAAENGFDKLAWTTGEQQAERYDLSKHINSIGYKKRGELHNITVWDKNDKQVLNNQSADVKWIEDHVGKEVAQKILNGEGRQEDGHTYLEGLDLKVGGEGMKGFYDQIMPSFLNKYAKKWGAKVGKTNVITQTEGMMDSRNALRNFGIDSQQYRDALVRENNNPTGAETLSTHSIDITPSMKESVLAGQPLFQRREETPKQKGFVKQWQEEEAAIKKAKEQSPKKKLSNMRLLGEELLRSTDGVLSTIQKKFKSEAVQKIRDMLWHQAGEDRGIGPTYTSAVERRTNSTLNRLARIVGNLDEEQSKRVVRLLQRPMWLERNKNTLLGKEALKIKEILDENRQYLIDAGFDVGEVEGYFPRLYRYDHISANQADFLKRAAQAYRLTYGDEITAEEAKGMAEAWLANALLNADGIRVGNDDLALNYISQTAPAPKNTKPRTLSKEADNLMRPFLEQDPYVAISGLIQRSTKMAEFNKRFGNYTDKEWKAKLEKDGKDEAEIKRIMKNGTQPSHWADLKDQMIEEGVEGEALTAVVQAIQHVTNTMTDKVSERRKQLGDVLRLYTYLRFLDRTVLYQPQEMMNAAIRSGDIMDGLYQLTDSVKALFKTKSIQEAIEISEDFLGATGEAANDMLMQGRWGGAFEGKINQIIAQKWFKATGLTQITTANQIAAVRGAQRFLNRKTKSILGKDSRQRSSKFLLRELGIPKGKEEAFSEWLQNQDKNNKEMSELYYEAIDRFMRGVILRPSRAERQVYTSMPGGELFYKLQSYTMSFAKNVLIRSGKMALEGTKGGKDYTLQDRLTFMAPAAMMLAMAAVATAMWELRDEVLYPRPDARELEPWEKGMKWASASGAFGGIDPYLNIFLGLRFEKDPAAALAGPALGEIATGLRDTYRYLLDNSKDTPTADRNFYKFVYNNIIKTGGGYATTRLPLPNYLRFAIIQMLSHPETKEAFITPLGGKPQKQKRGRY